MRAAPFPAWLLLPLLACQPRTIDLDDSVPPDGDTGIDTGTDTDTTPLVVWAVRHAEKDEGHDPELTKEGHARAQALVPVMADVPLAAVYATAYNRTQQTCQPTADDHGLEMVTELDPEGELADHVIGNHQHQQVLHCGHSWTLPDFLDALGVEDDITIGSDDYGDIWIVSILGEEVLSLETSHFGE